MGLVPPARASGCEHREGRRPQSCSHKSAGQKQLPERIHLRAAEHKPQGWYRQEGRGRARRHCNVSERSPSDPSIACPRESEYRWRDRAWSAKQHDQVGGEVHERK
jgi:hypothetical protein